MPKEKIPSDKQPALIKRGRGRPPKGGEETIQSVLLLTQGISDWLEELSFGIWKATQRKVSRSEIVREILQGVIDSGVDLTETTQEGAIRELVAKEMRR